MLYFATKKQPKMQSISLLELLTFEKPKKKRTLERIYKLLKGLYKC